MSHLTQVKASPNHKAFPCVTHSPDPHASATLTKLWPGGRAWFSLVRKKRAGEYRQGQLTGDFSFTDIKSSRESDKTGLKINPRSQQHFCFIHPPCNPSGFAERLPGPFNTRRSEGSHKRLLIPK